MDSFQQGGFPMNKLLIATAAVALATVGTAGAADLPMKAPPMVAPPVYSWTGCYIGVGGGYGMWNQDEFLETNPGLFALQTPTTLGGRGWFGTGQIGCDYQFNGPWVIGAFADGDVGSIKGVQGNNFIVPGFGPTGFTSTEKESSSWAVGGRIGYTPFPKLLTFVSGGWTQAHFDAITFNAAILGIPVPAANLTVPSHNYNGWFLGGGYEYGFDWAPGLFWKTEYRFAQYKADDLVLNFANGAPTGLGFNAEKFIQTVRTELVWRFNWGGPVVARY
jgi:outer membrane immunogenic protein